MGNLIRIAEMKQQLRDLGFEHYNVNGWSPGANDYALLHPNGELRLFCVFSTSYAELSTVPVAEPFSPEYKRQKNLPENVPTVRFTVGDGPSSRIIEAVEAYVAMFLKTA